MSVVAVDPEDHFPQSRFVAEVEANLEQAEREGWCRARTTAMTVMVTLGVLLANAEARLDDQSVRALRRTLINIIGAL